MQVPRLIAPGFTLGAALSNSTHERPCVSFPVTTRRIGFTSSAIAGPRARSIAKARRVATALSSCIHHLSWSPRRQRVSAPVVDGKAVLGGTHAVQWIGALALTIVPVNIATAQVSNFPNHTIKIIVGPSPDVFSRIVAEHLQEAWGQP